MTLSIRWDSSDTIYISGPPSERYVHWPLEISSNTSTSCSVAVSLFNSAGAEIVSQAYDAVPISSSFGKFNPAILVPDSYFATPQTWTMKAIIYTSTVPIETPRVATKTISNVGTGGSLFGNRLFLLMGVGLIYYLTKSKTLRRLYT